MRERGALLHAAAGDAGDQEVELLIPETPPSWGLSASASKCCAMAGKGSLIGKELTVVVVDSATTSPVSCIDTCLHGVGRPGQRHPPPPWLHPSPTTLSSASLAGNIRVERQASGEPQAPRRPIFAGVRGGTTQQPWWRDWPARRHHVCRFDGTRGSVDHVTAIFQEELAQEEKN